MFFNLLPLSVFLIVRRTPSPPTVTDAEQGHSTLSPPSSCKRLAGRPVTPPEVLAQMLSPLPARQPEFSAPGHVSTASLEIDVLCCCLCLEINLFKKKSGGS